jgi:hypothetical protein
LPTSGGKDAKAFSPQLVSQRSAQCHDKIIPHHQRAIDRSAAGHQIASHQDRGLRR